MNALVSIDTTFGMLGAPQSPAVAAVSRVSNVPPATAGFVNLINLLLGPANSDSLADPEATTQNASADVETATRSPQLIADALIRSMLNRSILGNAVSAKPVASANSLVAGKITAQTAPVARKERNVTPFAAAQAQTTLIGTTPIVSELVVPALSPPISPSSSPQTVGPTGVQEDNGQPAHQPMQHGTSVPPALPGTLVKPELAFSLRLTPIEAPNALPQPQPSVADSLGETKSSDTNAAGTPIPAVPPDAAPRIAEKPATLKEIPSKSPSASPAGSTRTNPRAVPETAQDAVSAVAAPSRAEDHVGSYAQTLEPASPAAPQTSGEATGAEPPPQTASQGLRASEPAVPMESPTASSSVQGIAVRIALPDTPHVDVQVLDRAGQVQVAVRTPDTGLQSSLRQDLGTLVNSLERSGFHAEAFTPHDTMTQVAASSQMNFQSNGRQQDPGSGEQGHPSGNPGGGDRDGQPESQQQQGQQRQRTRQSQAWSETMENAA